MIGHLGQWPVSLAEAPLCRTPMGIDPRFEVT